LGSSIVRVIHALSERNCRTDDGETVTVISLAPEQVRPVGIA